MLARLLRHCHRFSPPRSPSTCHNNVHTTTIIQCLVNPFSTSAAFARARRSANSSSSRKNKSSSPRPPAPIKKPFPRSAHGITWDDPYHWLSTQADDPRVLHHLQLENLYTQSFMAHTLPLQSKLKAEMASLVNEDQACPPERWGPWLYYSNIPAGQEYPVYCRKRLSKQRESWIQKLKSRYLGTDTGKLGNEQRLLDLNEIAKEHGYVHLGTCKVSKDHRFLAYTIDGCGKEVFTLFVKDLQTDQVLSNPRIEGVMSVEWARDNRTLLYTTVNDMMRSFRVFKHVLGSRGVDMLLFEEKDANYYVDVSRTKDWQYMTININSKTSSEVYIVNAGGHDGTLQLIEKRRPGVEYFVEHHNGYLVILTNLTGWFAGVSNDSSEYKLFFCPIEALGAQNWKQIIQEECDAITYDMDIFEKHLVLYQRKGGLPCVRVLNMPLALNLEDECLKTPPSIILPLPEGLCTILPGLNQDFYSSILRLNISSPIMPETLLDFDLSSKAYTILQQDAVKLTSTARYSGAKRPNVLEMLTSVPDEPHKVVRDLSTLYACEHLKVQSLGAPIVPLTLVYSRKLKLDGSNPALLMGYGAYGEVFDLKWCSDRFSLLDRGWLLAFSHVRGGGELGKSWHKSGKMLHKTNSMLDFLACADFLIEKKYVHRDRLAAKGVSAGGLLVAAAINMRPDLFRAAILKVPFLDVLNTMLDENLALTVPEYEEWGNPADEDVFHFMRGYSPYDNIKEGALYPGLLLLSSFLDTRVGYWEAAKYAARVRDCTPNSAARPVLLNIDMDSGHFGEGGLYQHLNNTALEYAFLLKMTEPEHAMGFS